MVPGGPVLVGCFLIPKLSMYDILIRLELKKAFFTAPHGPYDACKPWMRREKSLQNTFCSVRLRCRDLLTVWLL